MKRYHDLAQLKTFRERFDYLKLNGRVGVETFGFDRWINQLFYRSREWRDVRHHIIIRDQACDLGIAGREIVGRIYIHHINPVSEEDIKNADKVLLSPEYLICVSLNTHNAIHYGDEDLLLSEPIARMPNDTIPWRK